MKLWAEGFGRSMRIRMVLDFVYGLDFEVFRLIWFLCLLRLAQRHPRGEKGVTRTLRHLRNDAPLSQSSSDGEM